MVEFRDISLRCPIIVGQRHSLAASWMKHFHVLFETLLLTRQKHTHTHTQLRYTRWVEQYFQFQISTKLTHFPRNLVLDFVYGCLSVTFNAFLVINWQNLTRKVDFLAGIFTSCLIFNFHFSRLFGLARNS